MASRVVAVGQGRAAALETSRANRTDVVVYSDHSPWAPHHPMFSEELKLVPKRYRKASDWKQD